MSTDRELTMTDYIIDTGLVFQEMRVFVEGAVHLCDEEVPALYALARAQEQHELAETLSTITTAFSHLRDLVCDLQSRYTEEIKRQMSYESPLQT